MATYRGLIRAGWHPVQHISELVSLKGPFFSGSANARPLVAKRTQPAPFGWMLPEAQSVPIWNRNLLTGKVAEGVSQHWWTLGDFIGSVGDIKAIWEMSRFNWVLYFAQRAAAGDQDAVRSLNEWLTDWIVHNPPYRGYNWKCAQEASIRVIHLALAAMMLQQVDAPNSALVELIRIHLARIAPTISYAVGQDNNHGTSEAAALLIGGSWLHRLGRSDGAKWCRLGRSMLTERATRLISMDGSFSQYSVNYHRLALDTLSVAEIWRDRLGLEVFPRDFYERAEKASEWLRAFTDDSTGDAPNIGANDGANLLPLTDSDYRDFRPSVQLASVVFQAKTAYPESEQLNRHLAWLDVPTPKALLPPRTSALLNDGGVAILRSGSAVAYFRFPRFRFRPSHADALHVDLTVAGVNVLRDAGTFSYAATSSEIDHFAGVAGHNTIQFDDRDQMPRLSRFLWGDWLKTSNLHPIKSDADATAVRAEYSNRLGVTHSRRVELRAGAIIVHDQVRGFRHRAVLRWRLRSGQWKIDGCRITDGSDCLVITADVPIVRCQVTDQWESRYYLSKMAAPVVEVEIASAGSIISEYRWSR